ncbi:hypothetical protein ACFYVL_04185 [Streptomyces sp. NPDC004111]|uniref:hypothetical protein n=1 Tax=Streptomyces sp. NPDC004111 TaxID=3364690 RepID=UPI0036873756
MTTTGPSAAAPGTPGTTSYPSAATAGAETTAAHATYAPERLHFYPGQQLTSADLQVEQTYHLALRRLLHRGLFTPGVVSGLEVDRAPAPQQDTHVRITPGLALDTRGRELVVPEVPSEARLLAVPAQPPSRLDGYFLVARYAEELLPDPDGDPCARPATGQYARVRERADLLWTEDHPASAPAADSSSGTSVVLAYAVLTPACRIARIESAVRQYARPVHTSRTASYALEGEKDIVADDPKVLHFQIRGGPPSAVVLHLWGAAFGSAHYTETGEHTHRVVGTTSLTDVNHQHLLQATVTEPAGTHGHGSHDHGRHSHDLTVAVPPTNLFGLAGLVPLVNDGGYIVANSVPAATVASAGAHPHTVPARTTERGTPAEVVNHAHGFSATSAETGAAPAPGARQLPHRARSGPRHSYVSDLRVRLDGTDITGALLARLPREWQDRLGDGLGTHPLVTDGTDGIDLVEIADVLGTPLETGPHTVELAVGEGGGKVLYNLYVE